MSGCQKRLLGNVTCSIPLYSLGFQMLLIPKAYDIWIFASNIPFLSSMLRICSKSKCTYTKHRGCKSKKLLSLCNLYPVRGSADQQCKICRKLRRNKINFTGQTSISALNTKKAKNFQKIILETSKFTAFTACFTKVFSIDGLETYVTYWPVFLWPVTLAVIFFVFNRSSQSYSSWHLTIGTCFFTTFC